MTHNVDTAPALTQQPNRLERDLGHPLLTRVERGTAMKLSAFGGFGKHSGR